MEVFFRIILFKLFNKIETWNTLKNKIGCITWKDFDYHFYNEVLSNILESGKTIYSAAYIMPSGGLSKEYPRKHQHHLKLLQMMMKNFLPSKVANAKSMQDVFLLLRSYPMIGDFLAYQYATDLNYSEITNFTEMSFVIPGPGAKDGIRKCFSDYGGLNEVDIIKLMADRQEDEFDRLELEFENLWGRRLQLIDIQNLFCEVGKYARLAHPEFKGLLGRNRIKQIFRSNTKRIDYFYPPKWKINDAVSKTFSELQKPNKLKKQEIL